MAQRNTWEVSDGQHTTDVNVSEKIVICKRKEVPGITLTIGMFFDGTGNNVFNTDKRLLETCTSLDVGMKTEDAASCVEKLGKSGNGAGSYLGYYSNVHWLHTLYSQDNKTCNGRGWKMTGIALKVQSRVYECVLISSHDSHLQLLLTGTIAGQI